MRFRWRYVLVVVALMGAFLLAVACEGEEDGRTPTGTPTATVTANPTAAAEVPGITDTLSPSDDLAIEAMRMPRTTVVDGKGNWDYFGPLVHLEQP